MTETAPLGSRPLPFEVVFWDSEAPGYEGKLIRVSETKPPANNEATPGWRSDRRCRSSREIGLRLEKPCRLHQITVTSEPELAPSAVQFFVSGPSRRREKKLPRNRGVDERKWPKEPSVSEGHDDYVSSVFVNIGRAIFAKEKNVEGTTSQGFTEAASASLSGLLFKGQFLRLVLAEPVGSYANPGRQVSVAHIQVLGCSLEDEVNYRPQAANMRVTRDTLSSSGQGELEGILTGLGIEPSLAAGGLSGGGAPAGGGGEAPTRLQRSGSPVLGKTGFGAGWEVGGVVSEPALRAFKSVRGMLDAAQTEERFNEAEQLSLALNRVRSLGSKLCWARREQESASRREDFDEAKKFRDEAREAEIWLGQAVQDASEIFGNGAGPSRPGETARTGESSGENRRDPHVVGSSEGQHNGNVAAVATSGAAAKETGVAPSHSIGGLCQADASDRSPSSLSHRMPCEIIGEGDDDAQFLDGCREENGRGGGGGGADQSQLLAIPPWLTPGCARFLKPWRTLLGVPWPAGNLPDFSTVFSHKWAENSENGTLWAKGGGGGGGDGAGASTVTATAAAAVASIPWSVETSSGRPPVVPKPGTLLRTILRLVAASQDLRPPGPVPPDVAPFRLAGRADSRPSLCSFSAKDDDAALNGVSTRGRAFAYPCVDSTPCASHVTNWIEDNPRLAWGTLSHGRGRHRQHQFSTSAAIAAVGSIEGKVNYHQTGDAGKKTAEGKIGAGRPDEGRDRGRGDVENLGETADAAAAAAATKELSEEDTPLALPDVVGAGGFAELLPLLDAIIGRVPMSAACAGFPAQMREASIGLCEAHLELTAEVAAKAYAAAADAAAPFNPSTRPEKRQTQSSHSSAAASVDHRPAAGGGSLARREGGTADGVARGAVVRAGCLLAAQGLLDPSSGPRAAGESLAMSVLSLWSSPANPDNQHDKKQDGGGDMCVAGGPIGTVDNGDVGGTTAFLTQETFDEPGSVADGEGEGAKSKPVPVSAHVDIPKNTVPLRDLRWGLELLLGCVAPHLADGVDDDRAGSVSGTPAGQHTDGSIDKERRPVAAADSRDDPGMVTDVSSVTFDNGSVRDETVAAAVAGSDGEGSEPPVKKARSEMRPARREGDDEEGSRTACRLVEFACRHPDIGPALVASVLVAWIPHLADWGWRPAMASTAGNGRQVGGQCPSGMQHKNAVTTGVARMSTRRSSAAFSRRKSESCWHCSPAGETGASESLAAGAMHMLVFMVRRFPLLPMSDFSAETLNCAAEGSIGFGVRGAGAGEGVGGTGNKTAAVRVAARGGRLTSGRAQRAGEELMLELFLSRGGGGVDVLLPATDSVRGLASLNEKSAASVNRMVAGKEPKGGEEGANVAAVVDSSGKRLVQGGNKYTVHPNTFGSGSGNRDTWWMSSGRRKQLVAAKVEVRQRLPVPLPPTPTRRPSGPSTLGNEPLETINSAGDDTTAAGKHSDHGVFSLSDSTSALTLVDTSLSSAETCGMDLSQTSSDADRPKKGGVGGKGHHVSQSAGSGDGPGDTQHKRGSVRQEKNTETQHQANQAAAGVKRTSTGKGNRVFPLARSSGDSFTDSKLKEGDSTPISPEKDSDASGSRGASFGSHEAERTRAEDSTEPASATGLEKDSYERVPWRVPKSTRSDREDIATSEDGQSKTATIKNGAKSVGWMSRMFRRGK